MKCEEYKKLIFKYLEGIIEDSELAGLKSHIEDCCECRDEFNVMTKIENVVGSSLTGDKSIESARETILEKLSSEQRTYSISRVRSGWLAAAAILVLVIGLFAGFYAGKLSTSNNTRAIIAEGIEIDGAELEGTILVKHADMDSWVEIKEGQKVYVGDTFHCGAKSQMRLIFRDNSFVELNQNSMLVLNEYNGGTQFYLENGAMKASLESPHPLFVVSTPNGRVEALGTEFTVTVE